MSHANEAVAAALPPANGWILLSGNRKFGPLTDDELRQFFSSGVVRHVDTLVHPDCSGPLSAAEAALRLQVPAPVAEVTSALDPPVRHVSMSAARPSLWRAGALGVVMLLLLGYYLSMPKPGAGLATPRDETKDTSSAATATGPAQDSNSVDANQAGSPSGVWQAEAMKLDRAADWPNAVAHAQHWVNAQPDNGRAWQFLGRAQRRLGATQDAINSLQRASTLDPGNFWVAVNFAEAYLDKGDQKNAELQFRRAVDIDPRSAEARFWLAKCLASQTRYKDAIGALEVAADIEPENPDHPANIAYMYARLGNMSKALEMADKALALDPGNRFATEVADYARARISDGR